MTIYMRIYKLSGNERYYSPLLKFLTIDTNNPLVQEDDSSSGRATMIDDDDIISILLHKKHRSWSIMRL